MLIANANANSTLHALHCTLLAAHLTLNIPLCTQHSAQSMLQSVWLTLAHCKLTITPYTLQPAHLTQGESELLAALVPLTQWVGLEEPQQQVITGLVDPVVKIVHQVHIVSVVHAVSVVLHEVTVFPIVSVGQTVKKPQELSGKICSREVPREIRLITQGTSCGQISWQFLSLFHC